MIVGVYLWDRYHEKIRAWWGDMLSGRDYVDEFGGEDEAAYDDYLDDEDVPPAQGAGHSAWNSAAAPTARPIRPKMVAPAVVQLSVVAAEEGFFSGSELMDAFHYVGLRYGDMGIFHLYDDSNAIHFSVASIVEPGTFPVNNMTDFRCPGVVLFFQVDQVAEPLETFDRLVSCCHELAIRLNGVEWDADREPLTTGSIAALRNALA
ncbi:cell division protein ZipA C-terminal FtsZ-binding domain-containing protein [Methylogaea oryzae]|uniref:cell division protein ZipA C-terminal FtsZ-binding domain-containing protein n=1 Tax=Methylogaea oryzae TaxID=1295382 RepID=UPI0020D0A1DD|nr:cell division protein ZipA C-terminal FtsZ-binding domain-containing protein [Methylogaea oryzae]